MPARSVSAPLDGSIEAKLRAVLFVDDTGDGVIGRAGTHPRWAEHRHLTETELDIRDWGVIYGMAFAIARGDSPWESLASVAERALEPAWRVYVDWGTEIAEPTSQRPEAR